MSKCLLIEMAWLNDLCAILRPCRLTSRDSVPRKAHFIYYFTLVAMRIPEGRASRLDLHAYHQYQWCKLVHSTYS